MLAILRLLFALLLVALGTTAGAFAISGYFGPSPTGEPVRATAAKPVPEPSAKTNPAKAVPAWRTQFVANTEQPRAAAAPDKRKVVKAPPNPPKKKAEPKPRPSPQQAAAPWPWGIFSN